MDALILNSEGKAFRYEWTPPSSTVNVWTIPSDRQGWVNFDAFTRENILDGSFHAVCKEHMQEAEQVDPRYRGYHSSEEYLYGVHHE